MKFFFDCFPIGDLFFQLTIGKRWIITVSIESGLPDSVVVVRMSPGYEDVFGFWFEDFMFDRYRVN